MARNMDLEKESNNLSVLLSSPFLIVSSVDDVSLIRSAYLTTARCYRPSTITPHFSYDLFFIE